MSRRFEKLVKQNMCKIFAEIVKKKAQRVGLNLWPTDGLTARLTSPQRRRAV